MIHHSFTKDSDTVSWKAIERYHRETRGWKDIGYHYGVEQIDGEYYALVGRWGTAAACKEGHMNVLATHIMCCGNFDLAPPPPEMLELLINRLIVPVAYDNGITDVKRIVAHRDYAPYKTCPGSKFDMDKLRQMVKL